PIGSGAFVLAATGLLDGRRATTHWRYTRLFAERFPRIQLVPDVLYVDEGRLLTSAGSAAGLDLCLHVVRKDYGAAIANQVARRLVIAPQRMLETTPLGVETIAERIGMGTATNLRHHFRAQVRTTPTRYRRMFRSSAG